MNRKVFDLQIPRPLLDPTQWRINTVDTAVHTAADTHKVPVIWISSLAMGGAMERLRFEILELRHQLYISAPLDFFSSVVRAEPSWSPLVETQLRSLIDKVPSGKIEIVCSETLSASERNEWNELFRRADLVSHLSLNVEPGLKLPTLLEWSREVFPRSFRSMGELIWHKELKDYESQFNHSFSSLEQLRFWPGHLRRKNIVAAALANQELNFAEALFSPQSDRQSAGLNALLNPTLQVAEGVATWRFESQVQRRELQWQEAAIIDELRENPSVSFKALELELESKPFPFSDRSSFLPVIERMTSEGIILRR